MKEKINLFYFHENAGHGNFGDELSKFIVESLLNKQKYELVCNEKNCEKNIIAIGSYIHVAKNNYTIFGSGVRTNPPIEGCHSYKNLNVVACRGPKTRQFLMNDKNIPCPEVYGDPALLLPQFYTPKKIKEMQNKIIIIPHKSQFHKYKKIPTNYIVINPRDHWKDVVNAIFSAKAIISSSLHGLIVADAYSKPNIMLQEFELTEGTFKFKDYYESQKRPFFFIKKMNDYDEKLLYCQGNRIDINKLKKAFPFL